MMRGDGYYNRMCARCRCNIERGDSSGESGLYSPNRSFTLCEPCFFAEDEETEREGTNNLPDRLEEYRKNMRLGPIPGKRPMASLPLQGQLGAAE